MGIIEIISIPAAADILPASPFIPIAGLLLVAAYISLGLYRFRKGTPEIPEKNAAARREKNRQTGKERS